MQKFNICTLTTLLILLFISRSCSAAKKDISVFSLNAIPKSINLEQLNNKGVFILEKQNLVPQKNGIIAQVKLNLPTFKKGVYYRPFSARTASGNRVEPLWINDVSDLYHYKHKKPRMDNNINLGTFLMLKQDSGKYLVILPIVSNYIGNSFSVLDSTLCLTIATYGTRTECVETPLLAYAESDNPYEATKMAWGLAMQLDGVKKNINWRSNKLYPEAFKYLGWCSWEHYRRDINEKVILNSIKDIKSSILPIRWLMVDDGYLDQKQNKLLSFGVDTVKFPHGWNRITT